MPCAITHLLLAGRLLEDWTGTPTSAPIDAVDPRVRAAFLHGTLAPDMGFMPGVDRFVSELAHYHSPAELTRALYSEAESPEERAFAWGWAAHVVADVALHPQVGRAVGERLYGDRTLRMDAAADVTAHVAMEVGLDARLLSEASSIPAAPRHPHFDPARIRHLSRALSAVYRLELDESTLLFAHRRAVALTYRWPRFLRWVVKGRLLALPKMAARTLTKPGSAARGMLRASPPPDWLVAEVRSLARDFTEFFHDSVGDGLRVLENRNLETGEEAGAGRGHAASDEVARRLAQAPRLAPSRIPL